MNTAKKSWVSPKETLEEFTPNEYVSACWTVACQVDKGNYGSYGYSDNWRQLNGNPPIADSSGDINDHTGSCSEAVNNQFRVSANGSVTFVSENSSQQGTLAGAYDSYIEVNGKAGINDGDLIFWHTSAANGRRWNHYGTVKVADASHPNRS